MIVMQKIVNIQSADPNDMMKNMVLNNADVKAVKVKLEAGQAAENCVVDAPVLLFVPEGEGSVVIESEAYPLTEGDVTVVPSGKKRHLEAETKTFRVLAVQSHQADKTCGLCALLEDCVNLKD